MKLYFITVINIRKEKNKTEMSRYSPRYKREKTKSEGIDNGKEAEFIKLMTESIGDVTHLLSTDEKNVIKSILEKWTTGLSYGSSTQRMKKKTSEFLAMLILHEKDIVKQTACRCNSLMNKFF